MTLDPSQAHAHRLVSALAEALCPALASHTGTAWQAELTLTNTQADPANSSAMLSIMTQVRGSIDGRFALGVKTNEAERLLSGPDEQRPNGLSDAWLAIVQAATKTAEAVAAESFGKLAFEGSQTLASTAEFSSLAEIVLRNAAGEQTTVFCLADTTLHDSLGELFRREGASLAIEGGGPSTSEPKLHRVIDVPLAVTLRFGQRQLTLRELLELTTGSLVELDRQVEEPVELMLGDRIVARGDVVIVDGNYGLRVTEVVENAAHRLQLQALA